MNVDKIRSDFEILNKNIIYLDSACMSLRPNCVINEMNEYYFEYPGCAGRSYHSFGRKVSDKVLSSRENIAKFFNVKNSNEIIFTRNTTEGINIVANSLLQKGDVVIGSDKEHNSNLVPYLNKEGVTHINFKTNEDNTFNLENFKNTLTKDVKLVSILHTSNMDGVSFPIKEIIKIAHDNGSLVLVDAAQSAPHIPIDIKQLDVDFLVCSAHKMCGPSGVGMLYGKFDLLDKMPPFIVGGDTVEDTFYDKTIFAKPPRKFEAGLQNYSGIIGFSAAINYLSKIGMNNINNHMIDLNRKLTQSLSDDLNIKLLGPKDPSQRSGIYSFYVDDVSVHTVAQLLSQSKNIMVRSGAHCVHSWFNYHKLQGSVRASMYLYNTVEEINEFSDTLKQVLKIIK